ncbi:MAG: PhzF family phenazine biosynthesis protein [Mucilaginibacter sp.]|nr:PhzF family phenazine biosynthesis protein [Mucilaginibacter sp.]
MAMKKLNYYVLDVFTDTRYKGNQLSVVLTDEDLHIDEYYAISREFGYSETSFIRYSPEDECLDVRSFTQADFEVIGAGHNLLGAVCLALLEKWDIFKDQVGEFFVNIKNTKVPLRITEENGLPYVGMKQKPAVVKGTVPADVIAEAVGLSTADLSLNDWHVSIVETEVGHLMVPVKDVEALAGAVLNKALLKSASRKFGFEGCYLFSVNGPAADYVAESRFFNPSIGIDEDPATGTAAGPLAGYLELLGYIEKNRDYRFLQGRLVNQPSTIRVNVEEAGIWVSGSSVIVMKGELFL